MQNCKYFLDVVAKIAPELASLPLTLFSLFLKIPRFKKRNNDASGNTAGF